MPTTILTVIALVVMTTLLGVPVGTQAQEDKVISTTTDSRGFEQRHTEADLMYETAKQLMAAGQYDKAAAELEKVMALDATRLDALHDLGQCYGKLQQYDKAAAAYQKAVANNPVDVRLLTNLGYYQMRAKDIDGAMKTYNAILDEDPMNYEGHRWLGYIYERKAKATDDKALYETALGHYQKAVEAKPSDVETMGSIAKIYHTMGDDAKALETYEQAIPMASDEVALTLKSQLGKMYIDKGEFQKSADVFGDLVAAFPDRSAYRYNLGVSLIQLKRFDEATPHLEEAVKISPDFCLGYQPLATCYEANKRYSDALAVVQKGLAVCDANKKAGLYYEWGRSLEGLGRYGEAIDKFQMAATDPTWGPAAQKQIKRQEDLIKRAKAMDNN
jgi:tetratricopeptide (TPR) repeat protein